ncbi:MAG TPA: hypothetical protein VFC99_07900 [Acidimicrobiia bacterium]|nr:hypothetical protein [Acidimicrobiia bacterium]
MSRLGHLARRFFGALRRGGPRPADFEWVGEVLEPGELALWSKMPDHDRRHSVAVARRVEAQLAGTEHAGDTRWPAAALLHDVGKLDSHLSVVGRVLATMAGGAAGHEWADAWTTKRGVTRRFGLYLKHPQLGSDRILVAEGRPEVARWAAVHHDAGEWDRCGLPAPVVEALRAADDD